MSDGAVSPALCVCVRVSLSLSACVSLFCSGAQLLDTLANTTERPDGTISVRSPRMCAEGPHCGSSEAVPTPCTLASECHNDARALS